MILPDSQSHWGVWSIRQRDYASRTLIKYASRTSQQGAFCICCWVPSLRPLNLVGVRWWASPLAPLPLLLLGTDCYCHLLYPRKDPPLSPIFVSESPRHHVWWTEPRSLPYLNSKRRERNAGISIAGSHFASHNMTVVKAAAAQNKHVYSREERREWGIQSRKGQESIH